MLTRRNFLTNLFAAVPAVAVAPFVGNQADTAARPIHPGDLLVRRDDGLLYPFNHPHPFAGIATQAAGSGECVEYVEARQ